MRRLIVLSGFTALTTALLPAGAQAQQLTPQLDPISSTTTTTTVSVAPAPAAPPAEVDFEAEGESAKQDAVTNFTQTSTQLATDIKNDIYKGAHDARQWLLTPPPKQVANAVPNSYCYKSFQDVLCYRQPVPGWEHRLIAYQGTYAAAPPPAITEPLAMNAPSSGVSPAGRVAAVQPVFVAMPPPVKAVKAPTDGNAPPPMEAAHEALNPAIAPQL